jgi:hypothetical protein
VFTPLETPGGIERRRNDLEWNLATPGLQSGGPFSTLKGIFQNDLENPKQSLFLRSGKISTLIDVNPR